MKKISPKIRNFSVILALSVLSIQPTFASHPLFGDGEGQRLFVQESFYGLCQYVFEVKTYFFGIEIGSHLEFKYGECP
jgi:hypothetical protein